MSYRKKLIEVALPLEAINKESAREKSIRHGHPSTLHLWWARRPLAACRAVLFASLVDDPSSLPEQFPTRELQDAERQRLFRIIEDLVKWDNVTKETVLNAARAEIMRSTGGNPPPVLDPFCGGGSIPLEAQRLGLEAHGSDLNPVAVLITKALIEIPPKFAGQPPINPDARKSTAYTANWTGARGLAEDVRYYGKWMRDEAEKRVGHLYPKVKLPKEHGSGDATVIAWLWARTVKCPNPACGAQMPLVRSFWLSTKAGKEAWVEPVVERKLSPPTVEFKVVAGEGDAFPGTVNRRGGKCICCDSVVPFAHIRSEGKANRMSAQLMAIVAEGKKSRLFLSPESSHVMIAAGAPDSWKPDAEMPKKHRNFQPPVYGMNSFGDLFTRRQLVTITTYCDLVREARERVKDDFQQMAATAVSSETEMERRAYEARREEYATAVATYLAFAVDKVTLTNSNQCTWQTDPTRLVQAFARQAVPMVWDFAEANPMGEAAGDLRLAAGSLAEVLQKLPNSGSGEVRQIEAERSGGGRSRVAYATDPPYYDNISYADLSDYFYVWLRRSVGIFYPGLFETLVTPKAAELIAASNRFEGDRAKAKSFFEEGFSRVFAEIRRHHDSEFPVSVFYAFKQAESELIEDEDGADDSRSSTGWETMLDGLIQGRFQITGTWPMRTELTTSLKSTISALATSIVLVCRPRPDSSPMTSRADFMKALKRELPDALRKLQQGNIAPVDLAQAAIGPGMAVFSRFSKVVEADGKQMTVRTALGLINQMLDEVLAEQEGEFDSDTRWALAWFEQFAFEPGAFGMAETLSKAKNTSVAGLVESGFLEAKSGKVRLLQRSELPATWDPRKDDRLTIWEVTQHLIYTLEKKGEGAAGALLRLVGGVGETARDLAYRLYTLCERKKWAEEARAYNGLVVAWPELQKLAAQAPAAPVSEGDLFGGGA